jgi:hypothetical protein
MENSDNQYIPCEKMYKKYLKPKIDSKIRIGGTYQAEIPKMQAEQTLVRQYHNKSIINLTTTGFEKSASIEQSIKKPDN